MPLWERSLSKKIVIYVDERPSAALLADFADEDFGLLTQTFQSGYGGFAKGDLWFRLVPSNEKKSGSSWRT